MNDAFEENQPPKVQAVPYSENGSQVNLQVLSLRPQIVSKLRAFAARQSQNDYTDLLWLTNKYPQEIREFSGELNYEQRKAFCTRFAQNNANQEARVRRVKHVLKVI
jgi:predicted nucleotidyltransferase component of viral defense system